MQSIFMLTFSDYLSPTPSLTLPSLSLLCSFLNLTRTLHSTTRSSKPFFTTTPFPDDLSGSLNGRIYFQAMKITGKTSAAPNIPASLPPKSPEPTLYSDLRPSKTSHKPHRRRTRLRSVAPAGKRSSRPETPLLKWKTEEKEKNVVSIEDDEHDFPEPRRRGSQRDNPVSARKLAAVLWRLNLPEASMAAEARESGVTHRGEDEQVMSLSRARTPSLGHRNGKVYAAEAKDPIHSPSSASGARNGLCKLEPSFRFSNCAMEGLTKWDPVTTSNEARELYSNVKLFDRQVGVASVISSLESELEQARTHIVELKSEQRNSKKKLDHFLKKLSEEKSSWRRKEHEKIRAFIEDVKSDLHRERKSRQRTEIMNAKLVDELAEAKLLSKRYLQDYEKERKTRELVEEVCDELAKEIGEDKAEVEEIEKESMRFREEVEEERKMLQMAEVWREERVQMKLIDAKVALEEKYSQMNKLVADLENFLRSINSNPDLLEAELLRHAAASVNIQDINDFHYEPGNPDDIFSILEEMNFSPQQCPPSKMHALSPKCTNAKSRNKKVNHSNLSNMEEEDESGWETVSNIDDEQGSSYSPESVNKNPQSKAQSDSETDTAMSEVSEACSVRGKQCRKVSSIAARLWRSVPTNGEKDNCKVVSVEGMRLSNGATMSPDGGSGFSTSEIMEPLSSPETGHPQVGRVIKKGCMEWPRGVHRNSLKSKLLEARMESQKVQLRQVLKHKM